MRCHCGDWMKMVVEGDEDARYECDGCGDQGRQVEPEEQRFPKEFGPEIHTDQGYVWQRSCSSWSRPEDGDDIAYWFDVRNLSHMIAYDHFLEHRRWPEGFLPEGIYCGPDWEKYLGYKMIKAWKRMILFYRPKE